MKKFLFYASSAVIFTFLGFVSPVFSFLPLIFVIFIGLYRGPSAGATAGFFFGLFNGIFAPAALGVDAFTYSAAGYLAGVIPDRVDENSPVVQIVVSFAAALLVSAAASLIEAVFSASGSSAGIFRFGGPVFFTLLAPAVFFVFKKWRGFWFGELTAER